MNPHEKLRVEGVLGAAEAPGRTRSSRCTARQGVTIHDKHIELIARQMLRKVHIIEPGDTEFLPGDLVDRRRFEETNAEIVENGGAPASGASGAARDHEGVARHGLVAVGGLVPGDHAGAHRRGHRGQVGPAAGPEGERDHRQADPGRHGHGALPQRRRCASSPRRSPSTGSHVSASSRRPSRAAPASRRSWGSPASRPRRCSEGFPPTSSAPQVSEHVEGLGVRPGAFCGGGGCVRPVSWGRCPWRSAGVPRGRRVGRPGCRPRATRPRRSSR